MNNRFSRFRRLVALAMALALCAMGVVAAADSSSAGIRVMLMAYRGLHHGGTMKVKNANELVREVFEVTGFSDFVTLD